MQSTMCSDSCSLFWRKPSEPSKHEQLQSKWQVFPEDDRCAIECLSLPTCKRTLLGWLQLWQDFTLWVTTLGMTTLLEWLGSLGDYTWGDYTLEINSFWGHGWTFEMNMQILSKPQISCRWNNHLLHAKYCTPSSSSLRYLVCLKCVLDNTLEDGCVLHAAGKVFRIVKSAPLQKAEPGHWLALVTVQKRKRCYCAICLQLTGKCCISYVVCHCSNRHSQSS